MWNFAELACPSPASTMQRFRPAGRLRPSMPTSPNLPLSNGGTNTVALFHVPSSRAGGAGLRSRSHRAIKETFSRAVRVTGREDAPLAPVETIMGAISRVRLGKIDERQTTFPASMGVNLQTDATIEVEIEDGSEPRLPITTVKLQMRQRSICFTAPPGPSRPVLRRRQFVRSTVCP